MSDSTEVASVGDALGSAPGHKGWPRFWSWFWRGHELRDWQRPLPAQRAEFLRRARLSLEVARRVIASPEPFDGSVEPIACDLLRQSIHWSLKALAFGQAAEGQVVATEALPSPAWAGADETRLVEAAGNAEELARIRQSVDQLSFVELAELAPEQRALLLEKTRAIATQLIAELELSRRAVEAIWLSRFFRMGLIAAVLAGIAFALFSARDASERRNDLALGKAWRTSSTYVGGCPSPRQECAESPEYFFHTQEENEPWVEIDLGSTQSVSAVRVLNRKDCCTERAAPIIVEVSTNHHKWSSVARRDDVFTEWRADFPSTRARWVRLRLPKRAPFHLRGVRVLP